jgi:hypothetical protein
MSDPTPAEIAAVQLNVNNLIDLTNFVHQYAIDHINNAYLLQSQTQSDTGQAWADALIGGAIWGLGDTGFPGASFCAGILSGIFTMYTTNPPPNLQGAFATVWQRFDQTFLQANADLTAIYGDVKAHWNDTYKGFDSNSYQVSSLAQAAMPSKDEPAFSSAADSILKTFNYNLWKQTLKAAWYQWEGSDDPQLMEGDQNFDMAGWVRGFINEHPAYYITWSWDNQGNQGFYYLEIWLGQNATTWTDAAAPQNLCEYLFQDDSAGGIVRPAALTTRADVFSNFGLTKQTYQMSDSSDRARMQRRGPVEVENRPGKR